VFGSLNWPVDVFEATGELGYFGFDSIIDDALPLGLCMDPVLICHFGRPAG
jgi:hypothetical protein